MGGEARRGDGQAGAWSGGISRASALSPTPASQVLPASLTAGPVVLPAQVVWGAGRMPPIGLYREGLVLSWACDDRQCPLGAAWREPHRVTWWEWGLPCESATHRPVCLWEGPRSSGLRDGSLGPRRVLFSWYRAVSLPSESHGPEPSGGFQGTAPAQPPAQGLRASGPQWRGLGPHFLSPVCLTWVPTDREGPLPSTPRHSPLPIPPPVQHLPAAGAGPAEAPGY